MFGEFVFCIRLRTFNVNCFDIRYLFKKDIIKYEN